MRQFEQHPALPQGFSASFPQRFFAKIEYTESCWLWTGYIMPTGYAHICTGVTGYSVLAHRASWLLHFGPIPEGVEVCHDCDQLYPRGDVTYRRCVNPAHLFAAVHRDNMLDLREKSRSQIGELAWNNKLTEAEVQQICSSAATCSQLAAQFGISRGHVSRIKNRKTWFHLLGEN